MGIKQKMLTVNKPKTNRMQRIRMYKTRGKPKKRLHLRIKTTKNIQFLSKLTLNPTPIKSHCYSIMSRGPLRTCFRTRTKNPCKR